MKRHRSLTFGTDVLILQAGSKVLALNRNLSAHEGQTALRFHVYETFQTEPSSWTTPSFALKASRVILAVNVEQKVNLHTMCLHVWK